MAIKEYKAGPMSVLLLLFSVATFGQNGIFVSPEMKPIDSTQIIEIVEDIHLFSDTTLIRFSITTDFKVLIKNKDSDDPRDANFAYFLNDTILVESQMKINPRGNFRKNYCALPPLKLNLKKKEYLLGGNKKLDKIKLVSVCRNNKSNQQYIYKERLVYKLYNLMTEYSFATRTIHLSFIDTSEKVKPDSTIAFFIEPVDGLSKRLDAIEIESKLRNQDLTDYNLMNMLAVFQFMIGNLDWSVAGLHNIKLIKPTAADQTRSIAVPYDFDFCGLVNTSYAAPPPSIEIENVRVRVFRGFSRTPEQMQATFDLFRAKKDEIFKTIQDDPYLLSGTKKDVTKFIDEFFVIIESEFQVDKYFVKGARKE
jgi:hypothetical protein